MKYLEYSKIRDAFLVQKGNKDPGIRFGMIFMLKCDLEKLVGANEHIKGFMEIRELNGLMDIELSKAEKEQEKIRRELKHV